MKYIFETSLDDPYAVSRIHEAFKFLKDSAILETQVTDVADNDKTAARHRSLRKIRRSSSSDFSASITFDNNNCILFINTSNLVFSVSKLDDVTTLVFKHNVYELISNNIVNDHQYEVEIKVIS